MKKTTLTDEQRLAVHRYESGKLLLDTTHGGEHMENPAYYEAWFMLLDLLADADIPDIEIRRLELEDWLADEETRLELESISWN